jgi:transcriptional regulator with XRE-family HTH domain
LSENEFGTYIRSLRKERGLTLKELGKTTELSHPYLSQIETGNRPIPSPDILKRLADPLGVEYEDLLIKAGHIDATSSISKSMSYAASVIINTILDITDSAKERSINIKPYIKHVENFENHLEAYLRGGTISISDLKKMLWRLEGDGDSLESLIGSRSEATQIEGLLKALDEVLTDDEELDIRRKSGKYLKDVINYFEQQDITYNGHKLTEKDRQRILDMLKALFPEYSNKE